MLKFLKNFYLQYELVTCIYMFEPWEKKLINSFVALTLSLVIFSSVVYLPSYIETFLQFISPVPVPAEVTDPREEFKAVYSKYLTLAKDEH